MASSPDLAGHAVAQDRPEKHVVITGLGVVSPVGIGHAAYWDALCQRRSGVSVLPGREQLRLPARIGAAIDGFDARQYVKPRKAIKVMCREIQTGFAAAGLAVEQAALTPDTIVPERMGVVFGSEMLYCEPSEMEEVYRRCIVDGEFCVKSWGEAAMAKMYPLWMLMYLPNMIACHVGIAHDARGPNNTICSGDVSSLLAVIEAATIIQRGHADIMLTGGSSSRVGIAPSLYRGMDRLSRRVDEPAAACRPFDAERDGTVTGEGAAVFVLESEEHARARGAHIAARLRGWGQASIDPRQTGGLRRAVRLSIRQTLQRAALAAGCVGHVNAAAAGQVVEDAAEAQAIRDELGEVPVTAPKSFFGDVGAAAGALEMVASIMTLTNGQIPVTLNYHRPDPACPVQVVHGEPLQAAHPTALVLGQSRLGHAVALALEAVTGRT